MSIKFSCIVCKAKPGEPCVDTIKPGRSLPGRAEHHARVLAPVKGEAK